MKTTIRIGALAGVIFVTALAGIPTWASNTVSTTPNVNIYSDPPPSSYSADHPNYVAPPAPPPIYTDPTAKTYCREYSQKMRVEGRIQENYGTTCLQPDGSWRAIQ